MTLLAESLARWRPSFEPVGPPWWDDEPVIIVGAGSSLRGFDFERLRGLGHVLAVKSAWRDLPFADACCGMDLPWMKRERDHLGDVSKKVPLYLPMEDRDYFADLTPRIEGARYVLATRRQDRLSEDRAIIELGGNSGFAAFNLAFHKIMGGASDRCRLIVLLGYDYGGTWYAPDRYAHNPPGHNARYLPNWARVFDGTAEQVARAGIDVVNASPRSAIAAFPRTTIDEAVQNLRRLRPALG